MVEGLILFSLFIAIYAHFFKIERPNLLFGFMLFTFIFFEGTKWDFGVDWINYYDFFNSLTASNALQTFLFDRKGFEPGFVLYTFLLKLIFDNFIFFQLVTVALIYCGIFIPIYRITNKSFLSVFYLISIVPWYSGVLRQMMALVFISISLWYVIERKPIKFFLAITLGSFFHTTILLFYPVYLLWNISWFFFVVVILFGFVLGILSPFLVELLDSIQSYFGRKSNFSARIGGSTISDTNPLLGFMRKILTVTGLYAFYFSFTTGKGSVNEELLIKTKFFLMISTLTILAYFVGQYVSFVSSRIDMYISIIFIGTLVGIMDKNLTKKVNKNLFFLFVVVLALVFYSRLEYMQLFHPYSSIFYNSDFIREYPQ